MKREFLQEFRVGEEALPKEVIDAIMAENGKDIEAAKAAGNTWEEKKIDLVVEAFNKEFPNIKIVSDEAYKLSSSQYVRLVIAALRYIATPEDKVNIANLVKLYNMVTASGDEPGVDKDIAEELPKLAKCFNKKVIALFRTTGFAQKLDFTVCH